VFTARYALSPYIKQIRFVFKGLMAVTQKPQELGAETYHDHNGASNTKYVFQFENYNMVDMRNYLVTYKAKGLFT
jgi:hypothetical protein